MIVIRISMTNVFSISDVNQSGFRPNYCKNLLIKLPFLVR